jgi:putative endonuclease
MKRGELGKIGETTAVDFLKHRKFRIRETNFRCRFGEIDIVAEHKKCLVFVEVRTRSGPGFGTPEESITNTKKEHLVRSVQHYLQTHEKLPPQWRIDVIAIETTVDGTLSRIDLIENAVPGSPLYYS